VTTTPRVFVQDAATGRIRITRAAQETWGPRFARAGYRIDAIHTKAEFLAAADAWFRLEMEELALQFRGQDAVLDEILNGLPGWD